MEKAKLELAAARAVFGENFDYHTRDKPDVEVRSRDERVPPFGVEVTTVYDNEAQARLINVENYGEQIWHGVGRIPANDRKSISTYVARTPDGATERIVAYKVNAGEDLSEALLAAIGEKRERLATYTAAYPLNYLAILDFRVDVHHLGPSSSAETFFGHRNWFARAAHDFADIFWVPAADSTNFCFFSLGALQLMRMHDHLVAICEHLSIADNFSDSEIPGLLVATFGAHTGGLCAIPISGAPLAARLGSVVLRKNDDAEATFVFSPGYLLGTPTAPPSVDEATLRAIRDAIATVPAPLTPMKSGLLHPGTPAFPTPQIRTAQVVQPLKDGSIQLRTR